MECQYCHRQFSGNDEIVHILDVHGLTIDHGCGSCILARHPDITIPAA